MDTRVTRANTGRRVYLGLLALLAIVIAKYLWGDFFILQADGFVIRDRTVIEATYLAEVESVAVREGQSVRKGVPVLQLKSIEILEKLAELSAQHASLVQRAADFKTQAHVAEQLVPLAQRREREARSALENVESLSRNGLTTAVRRGEVLRALYDAREAHLRYSAQAEAMAEDLPEIEKARRNAETALADLLAQYGGGIVLAPADGVIGDAAPSPGQVFRPGEPMMVIHSGALFCLVYLPRDYLFPIRQGARVTVRSGRRSAIGVIDEILPVSGVLPQEFQQTFRPQDRNQLAKIRFEETPAFSIGEKISVSLKLWP